VGPRAICILPPDSCALEDVNGEWFGVDFDRVK
jgi:hypothetical protein